MTSKKTNVTKLSDHYDLLTPQELAARWGVTVGHLANLRHQGKGVRPFKPTGGKVFYKLEDVIAYENS